MTEEQVYETLRRLDVTLERIERGSGSFVGEFITGGDAHRYRRALRLCDDAAIERLGLHKEAPRPAVRKHQVPYCRTPQGVEAIGGKVLAALTPGVRVTFDVMAVAAGLSPGYIETPVAALVRDGKLHRTRAARGKPALYWRPE